MLQLNLFLLPTGVFVCLEKTDNAIDTLGVTAPPPSQPVQIG